MHEILALCIELDERAEHFYRALAERLGSEDLRALFRALADEERTHVGWWSELLDAWDRGLLPDIVDDPGSLLTRLRHIREEMSVAHRTSPEQVDPETALGLAARVEFFMLDPVFSQLIDLMEPAHATSRHDAYSHHVQRLVAAIARHAQPGSTAATLAKVLERTWSDNRELTRFATQDPLTGLRNRRALDTHLPQWLAWAARYGRPIALVLVDLDGLKGINDGHGHRAGDRALKAVAESIRSSIRASDLALRYGGDEFAIVAPESGVEEYEALARRLLDAVRSRSVTVADGVAIPVRVSVGGAIALDPAGSRPRSVDELIVAADTSLYEAKDAGRDRAGAAVTLELR
ncbi:diguanylate cyclase [Coriobacteriia bacterium Es71-Z0120]|uniref:GGDEF domain-containing protein n=1 Tax=Parvivirga hydrogeniphila TaxID=2939460 RepID=UPI002260DE8E|nr:diguanylate cyclase [Parvivirga hydrogeniphila]MCL4078637.1 diguanylate cyclase [Parvivirga hydrogeniphila]